MRPWLYAIVRYKVVDAFRARGRRVQVPIEDFAEVLAAPEAADPTERGDVERVIGRLDPRSARIVRAIGLDGASVAETAGALAMTETAVRVALHRAMRKLARLPRRDDRMRTDELIRAMAADTRPAAAGRAGAGRDDGRASPRAVGVVALAVLGLNPDLGAMMTRAADAAAAGLPRCCSRSARRSSALRLARPGAEAGPARLMLGRRAGRSPAASCCASSRWCRRPPGAGAAMGETERRLPAVDRPDRAAAARAARSGRSAGAPRPGPRASGALAGLLAGAIAAAIYALHCTETSPLFYAAWYGLAHRSA